MPHHTALYDEHVALGATLVDFGGWDMPLWYPSGAVKEHLAVITGAGLFDIGHMSGILVTGPGAFTTMQRAFTRDLAGAGGRAAYGAFLDAEGGVVDDAIVYPLGPERFFVVINVGKSARVAERIRSVASGPELVVRDLAGTYAKLDLQGPAAGRVLGRLLADPAAVYANLGFFAFRGDIELSRSPLHLADGTPLFLSRTGYTGELGFEIFVPADRVLTVWRALLEAGTPDGVIPCGLAARDSLRAGAVLPLAGQDIGPWPYINNPWPFTLPRRADGTWTKDFIGREALNPATAPHTLAYCGFDPRKVTSSGHAHPSVLLGEERIGEVLTCVADVALGRVEGRIVSLSDPGRPEGFAPRGLICGFVRVDRALAPGTRVRLSDGRRTLEVEIVADIRPHRSARARLLP